jgi:aspartyl-tRNA(Asn)/glutamyl-tRNA(Gln) amidotransferase subunit C
MISDSDIDNLAQLARIALSAEEKAAYRQDLESILGYVSDLGSAEAPTLKASDYPLVNVLRTDDEAYPAETHTAAILAEAPLVQDNYIAVKKILDNGGDN